MCAATDGYVVLVRELTNTVYFLQEGMLSISDAYYSRNFESAKNSTQLSAALGMIPQIDMHFPMCECFSTFNNSN